MRQPQRLAVLALALLCSACRPALEQTGAELVVGRVDAGGAGEKAGLRPGDVILAYRRPAAPEPVEIPLQSCFRLAEIEVEQGPRGPGHLLVRRGDGAPAWVDLPDGEWRIEPRPASARSPESRACLDLARAGRWVRARRWNAATAAFQEAAAAAREARKPLFEAVVRHHQGNACLSRRDWVNAERAFRESLRLRRQAAPASLAVSASLGDLGALLLQRDRLEEAFQALEEARRLRSRHAPDSLALASTLHRLGQVEMERGLPERAGRLQRAALAIARRRSPGSRLEIDALNHLAFAAYDLGDLATAEAYLRQARSLQVQLAPEAEETATNLLRLGVVALERGDLAAAEEHLHDALRRLEEVSPDSLKTAWALIHLGRTAGRRQDFDQAETFYRRALAIRERVAPGTPGVASVLNNLSGALLEQGRVRAAETAARRALKISQETAPECPEVANGYFRLGEIAYERGDLAAAQVLLGRALALRRAIAPGSTVEAALLRELGIVANQRGNPVRAEALLRESVALQKRLAPGGGFEAAALHHLGLLLWAEGRLEEAETALSGSLDAFEMQVARMGGSDETRSKLHVTSADLYLTRTELDLERDRPAQALHTLERWRARSLLEMLAERDLIFSQDVPAALLTRQRRIDKELSDIQEELARFSPAQGASRLKELQARLRRSRGERAALVRKIARASPHYASLRHPRPLDLPAVRRALDPGTLWLTYCVTGEQTLLFAVVPEGDARLGDEGVQVFVLPAGRRRLEREVEGFRGLILRGRPEPRTDPALLERGSRLFALLLAPAATLIEGADRLLISPDGPLHELPFAALVRPGKPPSFLVEWKPVHEVLSATLYAELRHGRSGPATGPLVAFGDPAVRAVGPSQAGLGSPLRHHGRRFSSLPFSRLEVSGIAALYGPDATVYLGPDATEERVRRPEVAPRHLHFASHGLLDRRFPLESALALTPGGGDDGLLQAWEVFEKVRLNADLVTLSACETGLGADAGGEGLIGLTRAFQYAGARSVLASLWAVSDRSTALLMRRFYAGLRQGVPKDEALREAQLHLLQGGKGRFSHPFHWAAFELTGDWR